MLSVYYQKQGVAPLIFQMIDMYYVDNEFAVISLLSKEKYLII